MTTWALRHPHVRTIGHDVNDAQRVNATKQTLICQDDLTKREICPGVKRYILAMVASNKSVVWECFSQNNALEQCLRTILASNCKWELGRGSKSSSQGPQEYKETQDFRHFKTRIISSLTTTIISTFKTNLPQAISASQPTNPQQNVLEQVHRQHWLHRHGQAPERQEVHRQHWLLRHGQASSQ